MWQINHFSWIYLSLPVLQGLFYHPGMAAKSKQSEETGEGKDLLRVAFGRVLREYRNEIKPKVRQAVLSARAGLPSNAIGDLERGERTIKAGELKSICKVLGVSVKVFMNRVQRAQLKALGEPESVESLDEAASTKAPDQLYLTLALAGRNVEDVIRMVHRMINASGSPNPEEE
ncbi:MAG TPA: helix-turn-helix transcriptional regulator [Thermoanaerobaculia bacterium]|nr:helix-turn-helix transcriptional regulator [Thermoanaerobaculia bacterium]